MIKTSGLVTLGGEAPLNADSIFDGNMDRLDIMARDFLVFQFPGEAQAGVLFDGYILPYDCIVEAAIFKMYQGMPVGQNLIAQVVVNSVTSAYTFTCNAAGATIQKVAAGGAIIATAGQTIEMKFSTVGTTVIAVSPCVVLQVRKVVTG